MPGTFTDRKHKGGMSRKPVLFIFSDDVIESFTEDPSKSARVGVFAKTTAWGGAGGLRAVSPEKVTLRAHTVPFCLS